MVKALDTIDGVGLARPLCQEPFLCSQILTQKTAAALTPILNQYDFGLTAVAACIQIRQMGSNLMPVNLAAQDEVNILTKAIGEWAQRKQQDRSQAAIYPPVLPGYSAPLSA